MERVCDAMQADGARFHTKNGLEQQLKSLTYLLLLLRVTQRDALLSRPLHHEAYATGHQNSKKNPEPAIFHLRACSTSPTTVARWAIAGGGSCGSVRTAAAGRKTTRQGC
jgi:hypothetical protein